MSAGNGGAAIGLPNTNKVSVIGGLVGDTVSPTAGYPYLGENLGTSYTPIMYWDRNWLQEDAGFTIASCNSAKTLLWGNAVVALTVPADGRVSSAAGVLTAAAGTGGFKTFATPGTVMPAGSWLWVETAP